MDNLEQLSDDELRRRLLQFGFPNLPVTSTTRKILIKKLRNYMETERSKLRRETAHATRYSSDEDLSDNTTGKRRSVSARAGRSAASRATIAGVTNNAPTAIPEPSTRSTFTRPAAAAAVVNKYQPQSRMNLELSRPTVVSTPTIAPVSRSPTVYVSPMVQGSSGDDDTDEDTPDFGPSTSSPTHSSTMNNGQAAGGAGESPYVSEFTQRLLNLRGLTKESPSRSRTTWSPPTSAATTFKRQSQYVPPPSQHYAQHYHSTSNNNNHYADASYTSSDNSNVGAPNSASPKRSWISSAVDSVRHRINAIRPSGKHSSMVPCILHSMLLAFFVLVAVAYLAINPNLANTILAADTKFMPCTSELHAAGVPCIDSDALDPALHMIRRTAIELQRRAVEQRCRDASVQPHMSAQEMISDALGASGGLRTVAECRTTLRDMAYLVHNNPQWGIQQCDADGQRLEWSTEQAGQQQHFVIPNPTLSLRCKLSNKLQTFFTLVGAFALLSAIAYGAYALFGYVRRVRQARKDAVDFLIADIIQALMEKASASAAAHEQPDGALVVINHLRDQLIPPAQRVSSAWAWTEAIRFLEANESRIHFDVGTHNGEDCQMMRWLAAENTSPGSSPRSRSSAAQAGHTSTTTTTKTTGVAVKKWQSPAFDMLNKISDPPTQCLKIRHMFEPHETATASLQMTIQDAILEKVHNTGCRIVDVQLDLATCCVYVRCASPSDAGIVHGQINGWWFDSRLVSIKFLHLERYESRFPLGHRGPKCLQPSNTKMLSMSACRGRAGHADANGGDEF